MGSEDRSRPLRIAPFPNGELGIVWADGHESNYPGHPLRCACSCALCVEEGTGRKVLRAELVPRDVQSVDVKPVGRYGINIRWSDGHNTGIYTFERLRELCPCGTCGISTA